MIVDFRRPGHTRRAIQIHDEKVEIVHSYKYLGTIFEDTLKWDLNTEAITKKGHQRLHRLRKLRSFNVYWYWSLLYSAILRSRADSLRSHVILHEWIAFYSAFLNIHRSGVLTALAWLVPQESAARESQSRRVLCTPYNHAPCHFMQSHIRKVYACLAVTCHLRFWQKDRGLLRATTVTRGWNGYRNKSQHRKLTLEKKILPPLQQGFEPATFRSRVRCSNHWAIPAPRWSNYSQALCITVIVDALTFYFIYWVYNLNTKQRNSLQRIVNFSSNNMWSS